jgi:hypothetical protein
MLSGQKRLLVYRASRVVARRLADDRLATNQVRFMAVQDSPPSCAGTNALYFAFRLPLYT